jgi:hypothetical protein
MFWLLKVAMLAHNFFLECSTSVYFPDNPVTRQILVTKLERLNLSVTETCDGNEAVKGMCHASNIRAQDIQRVGYSMAIACTWIF